MELQVGIGRRSARAILIDGDGSLVLDLRPPELKRFIEANREALLAEAGFTPPPGRCNA